MKKKEYIEKIKNLIIQRVKYHAPQLHEEVDLSLLEAVGINPKYPIFLYKKPLDKIFYKAFKEAKQEINFNLILLENPLVKQKEIENLDKTYLFLKDEMGCNLSNTLENLNINYLTHSDFKNELKNEYIKINNSQINFDYLPYFYTKKVMYDGVVGEVKQFLLNGKNNIINLLNTRDTTSTIKLEINIPLPRGYYIFDKGVDCIKIKNLYNHETAYLNYNFKNAKIRFSNMSGIESCTFACIHLDCEISLLPKQKLVLFYNFGENKYMIKSPKMLEYFFKLSQIKMNEIFDLKVQSRNNNFDNNFNLSLPRKIWEKWQKYDVDEESINEWLKIKSKIIKSSTKGIQIAKDFKDIKEVRFFRNLRWKRVFVLHNNANYMYADKVKYFNYDLLTKEIFEKNNEIYLSFAD